MYTTEKILREKACVNIFTLKCNFKSFYWIISEKFASDEKKLRHKKYTSKRTVDVYRKTAVIKQEKKPTSFGDGFLKREFCTV